MKVGVSGGDCVWRGWSRGRRVEEEGKKGMVSEGREAFHGFSMTGKREKHGVTPSSDGILWYYISEGVGMILVGFEGTESTGLTQFRTV